MSSEPSRLTSGNSDDHFRYETDVLVYSAQCVWKIRNWRHAVKEGTNDYIDSPQFHDLQLPDVKWHLRLWPNRRYSSGQTPQMDVAVFPNRSDAIHSSEMVCSLWSSSPEDDKERVSNGVIKRLDYWGLSSRICGKPDELAGRDLILECTMRYALKSTGPRLNLAQMETLDRDKLELRLTRNGRSRREENEESEALNSYRALLMDEQFSDVTLVLRDQSWPAHRAILAQRSPVFRAMFSNPMWEQRQKAINLLEDEDVDSKIWTSFMHFIYSGSAPDLEAHCWSLLKLADKYEMTGLRSLSSFAIAEQLTNDTIPHALVLAFLHNANELRDSCLRFIRGAAPTVYGTPEWRQLMSEWPDIAADALTGASPPIRSRTVSRSSQDNSGAPEDL